MPRFFLDGLEKIKRLLRARGIILLQKEIAVDQTDARGRRLRDGKPRLRFSPERFDF